MTVPAMRDGLLNPSTPLTYIENVISVLHQRIWFLTITMVILLHARPWHITGHVTFRFVIKLVFNGGYG